MFYDHNLKSLWVIYDVNVSCLFNKTAIATNLALGTSICYTYRVTIYDHKVCYKLKHTLQSSLMIVKVQATDFFENSILGQIIYFCLIIQQCKPWKDFQLL